MNVTVTSYHADGSIAHTSQALTRERPLPPEDWADAAWHIRLSNGKRITAQEPDLDTYYAGWRDLPEATA